jgi:hypothetical protein
MVDVMSRKFIELVSEFDTKYVIPIDSITTVYQSEPNSPITEVYYGKEDFVRTKTPYDVIVNKLFE